MFRLTTQQQLVIATALLLLLIGWAVKSYRLAHPPEQEGPTPTQNR